jgi:hypothetical protein
LLSRRRFQISHPPPISQTPATMNSETDPSTRRARGHEDILTGREDGGRSNPKK